MSRPTDRTDLLSLDDAKRILLLFHSIPHAYECLAPGVDLDEFRLALKWQPIRPEDRDEIAESWHRWCLYFGLRNDVVDYRYSTLDNPGRDVERPIHPRTAEAEISERRGI